MKSQKTSFALAAAALCAASVAAHAATPAPTSGTLEIWWKAPASGATVSGLLQDTTCYVNGRGVSKVEFFLGSTRLNTDTAMSDGMSCVLDTTKFANGSYTLTAIAYDSAGHTYKEPRSIKIQNSTATNTPPSVSISSPASGATLSGTAAAYAASATDSDGVAKVDIYVDSTLVATKTTSPYSGTIDTTRFANGAHTLKAVATDTKGATSTAQIGVNVSNTTTTTNTPPAVSFSKPLSGSTVSGAVSCLVSATDSDGIKQLQWFLDSTLLNTEGGSPFDTCNLDSTKFADGVHTLKAVATDNKGAVGQASVSLTIKNGTTTTTNTPPTVSLNSPTAGATVSGTAAALAASATDSDGVAKVDFYVDATLVASKTASPYSGTFDTTKFANGTHTLKAVATDTKGASSTAQVSVNVSNTTTTTNTPPAVSFSKPLSGSTVSGVVSCLVSATDTDGIKQLQWFLDSTLLNTEGGAPFDTCNLDTRKFADGAHTLKAVATDNKGAVGQASVGLTIKNGTTTTTNTPPSVSLSSPTSGATLSGSSAAYAASATDSDGIAKVDFYVDSTLVATKTASPYSGTIDTTKFANGTHTVMAVATDTKGAASTAQVSVNVSNQASSGTGGTGGTSAIDSADILTRATADSTFSSQSGYTAQAINTYTSAPQIPESGINGTTLPNGETLRLGKVVDPANSVAKALSFQVINSDPTTSGGKRAELSVNPNIDMNKVYWAAFSVYVYDWGTLGTSDQALFGTQLHSGNNSIDLSPAFGLYTTNSGRNFKVQALYSTSTSPSQSNTVKSNYADQPIPFGQWVDFVFKFRQSTSGGGYLQVWMNGTQIVNHQGNLGFNTGATDYMKFGYYNWSGTGMGSTARKVLLRSPTIVADPTGSKYGPDQLRALISSGSATSSTTTTASTSTSGGGVCSTATCVITQ